MERLGALLVLLNLSFKKGEITLQQKRKLKVGVAEKGGCMCGGLGGGTLGRGVASGKGGVTATDNGAAMAVLVPAQR